MADVVTAPWADGLEAPGPPAQRHAVVLPPPPLPFPLHIPLPYQRCATPRARSCSGSPPATQSRCPPPPTLPPTARPTVWRGQSRCPPPPPPPPPRPTATSQHVSRRFTLVTSSRQLFRHLSPPPRPHPTRRVPNRTDAGGGAQVETPEDAAWVSELFPRAPVFPVRFAATPRRPRRPRRRLPPPPRPRHQQRYSQRARTTTLQTTGAHPPASPRPRVNRPLPRRGGRAGARGAGGSAIARGSCGSAPGSPPPPPPSPSY